MSIFDKRINYRPFEYPEVNDFVRMINKSYWVHEEVDFSADVQDFKTKLAQTEKEVLKRSLLGIAQIEVAVKTFWGNLYNNFPKPEMNGLGSTFAECEYRHSEAYARLLEVLGYEKEFKKCLEIPVFKKRLDLIQEELNVNKNIVDKTLFFTLVIENSSLFSQFANILSFSRFKGYMKNVANIIAWTSTDEQIHAQAGIFLLNKLKEEGFISEEKIKSLRESIIKYLDIEIEFLNWIYAEGELDFYSKDNIISFMKKRIDDSLIQLSIEPIFNITGEQYKPMLWYDEETMATELDDFFAKRPVAYTKHDKSITKNDLF